MYFAARHSKQLTVCHFYNSCVFVVGLVDFFKRHLMNWKRRRSMIIVIDLIHEVTYLTSLDLVNHCIVCEYAEKSIFNNQTLSDPRHCTVRKALQSRKFYLFIYFCCFMFLLTRSCTTSQSYAQLWNFIINFCCFVSHIK